jgi:hypothetical protein
MPFARLNGVVCLVEDGGSERTLEWRGDVERSARGNAVDHRRQARRKFNLKLSHMTHEQARGLAHMAIGLAHVFSFNGEIAASTSLGPTTAGHDAHLAPGDGWDGDALVVRSGGSISFDAQLSDEWTVTFRFRDATLTGSPWRIGAVTHDGREWIDAVELIVGIGANLCSVASGIVTLYGKRIDGVAAELIVDELAIFPWRIPDDQLIELLSWEQPLGPAPIVHLVGDVVESPLGILVAGKADRARVVSRSSRRAMRGALATPRPRAPFVVDDEFLNNALIQDLELVEVGRVASVDLLPLPLLYVPMGAAFYSFPKFVERVSGLDLTDPGSAHGSAAGPDGNLGTATTFGGTVGDRAFRFGTEGSAVGSSAKLTVAGWVRPNAIMSQTFWSRWNEVGNAREWRVRDNGVGSVVVEVSNGDGTASERYTTSAQLSASFWTFVSFDYDAARAPGSRVRIFLNGRPVFSSLVTVGAFAGMTTSAALLHAAGQSDPGTGVNAHVAQWACWTSALTTEQQRIVYLLTKRGHPLRRA